MLDFKKRIRMRQNVVSSVNILTSQGPLLDLSLTSDFTCISVKSR